MKRFVILLVGCSADAPPSETIDAAPPSTCPEGAPAGEIADKPTVSVTVNAQGPFVFIYDTGAPTTVIDSSLEARVGRGPYTLEVAGTALDASTLASADLARSFGISGVQGILGTDVLGSRAVTVDRRRGRFWLEALPDEAALEACAHAAGGAWLDVVVDDYLYLEGRVEDLDGWFLVDSGATLGALNASVFARLDDRPALTGFYTPAGIGAFWAELASVRFLEVGAGLRVEHLAVRTIPDGLLPAPPPSDAVFLGLLPNGFLKHFLMTVDYPGQRLRLAPYVDDPLREPPFAYSVGIGLAAEDRTPPRVGVVLPGSAAEASGVVVGEAIERVGGVETSSLPLGERPWALLAPAAGVVIPLTVGGRDLVLETRDLLTDPPP